MTDISYRGLKRWLTTTNHKDIGILYLITSLYFLFLGGSLAMFFRVQLSLPEMAFLDASKFNQAITVHGLLMVLWAVSPLAFAFANYFVPLQIGARDLAFPRLNAMSYWLYLFSGLLFVSSVFFPGGGPDVGWTYYAPLSTGRYTPQPGVSIAGLAIILLSASVTLGTINFIVTIAKMRAPGMRWMDMPMFTWGVLFTVFLMLFAFPSLAAAVLLLAIDRLFGAPFFSGASHYGAILWGHMFWFFGHPEVYIVLLPAFTLVMDIIATFSGREIVGKKYIIYSFIAASVLSFIVYIHHMFTTGINPIVREVYSITTETISIPFGVATLLLIATLYKGRIRLNTPMLFSLAVIFNFLIGGSTGVYNSSVALDHWLRGTYWVVGHLHYQLVAATLFGLLAGLYYYFPKMTGRMYDEGLGKLHFIVAFAGINVLYFPMFLLYDMPRRIYTYEASTGWGPLNLVASIGGWTFGLSFLIMVYNFIKSYKTGAPAGDNPWNANTLEWTIPSPPPRHDFDVIPVVGSEGTALNGGKIHDPGFHEHHTYMPFLLSLGVFTTFIGLFIDWILTLEGLALLIGVILYWYRSDIKELFAVEEVEYSSWPFTGIHKEKLGTWVLLASEAVLFASVIGAYLFIRVNTPGWPPSYTLHDLRIGFINTVILLTSSLFVVLALSSIKRGSREGLIGYTGLAIIFGLLFIVVKGFEWSELAREGFVLGENIIASTYYVATGLHAAHVVVGLLGLTYIFVKALLGGFSQYKYNAVENIGLYWHFVDIVWLFLFPLFYLI